MTPLPSRTPNENSQTTSTVIGILPRETPDTLHGIGEGRASRREYCDTREKWDLSTNTNLPWGGGGSRQRTVESYIFGSQPCVQKGLVNNPAPTESL